MSETLQIGGTILILRVARFCEQQNPVIPLSSGFQLVDVERAANDGSAKVAGFSENSGAAEGTNGFNGNGG